RPARRRTYLSRARCRRERGAPRDSRGDYGTRRGACVGAHCRCNGGNDGGPMEIARSRLIRARPEQIWPYVEDIGRWPEWFTEAESGEITSGQGLGRTQTMR